MARTLKRGDHGVYVERLQAALIAMGFPVGTAAPDGDFGTGTESAVRRFQAERGLSQSGIADPETIAALDLDPETLKDLIELDDPRSDAGASGDDADRIIQDYADSRADFEAAVINSLQNALDNFDDVLSHASTQEAKPDVMGAVFDKLLESLVKDVLGELAKVNPWAKAGAYVIDGFKAASDEMKRAEKAQRSVQVRDWILRQREIVDQAGWAAGDRTRTREDLRRQLAETDDARAFLDGLTRAIQVFRDARVANRSMLGFELTLFETWINAFFTGTRGPGQGYVVLIFDTDSDPWELKGTRLLAPEGDKVKDRVGAILARAADPADAKIREGLRPFALDLRVHKFVVFGHSGSNFLVAEEMGEPFRAAALNAAYPQWGAFFDPDNERLTTPTDELSRLRMEAALGGDNRLELAAEWS